MSFYDLNIKTFLNSTLEMQKSWTINRKWCGNFLFNYVRESCPNLLDEIFSVIESNKIKFVGFSVFNTNRIFVKNLIKLIKQKFPFVKIIAGGPEIFSISLTDFSRLRNADYYVTGEGEIPLYQILVKKSREKYFNFQELKELNHLPDFNCFDFTLYPRKNTVPTFFGKGCINKCKFCAERLLYRSYRHKNIDFFIDEILSYKSLYNAKWIVFYDSMLNVNLPIFEELLTSMIEKKLDIQWEAQIGIRKDMKEELFYKVKESGCINLFIGLESGSMEILKKMGKPFTPDDASLFFKKLHTAKIHFEISIIIGYPGETQKDFEKTIEFIDKNIEFIPKIGQVSIYRKYPGIISEEISREERRLALKRLEKLINFFEKNKIKYTKSYINNLL